MSKPDTEIAAMVADGPGTGITLTPKLRADLTKNSPGSDIRGVPASEIKEILFPLVISSKISLQFFFH